MKQKRIGIALVVLEVFVALGAVAGGIGLLTGAIPASLDSLQGSPFVDYTIPAWLLMVIVGGSMLLATATLFTGRERGVLASVFAGLTMMIFEIAEAAIVDRSGGSWLVMTVVLQSFYFVLGLAIVMLSSSLWMTKYRSHHFPIKHAS
ncbi:hypothetical protein KSC_043160 [Ktedonobacter sp. SOSP1-52]|uniref:hypothetical protein n=1 Tax=Ktedonobacter sp. SOSP1-52 TaxID=2778366 RepID=UPI0019167BE5|nr:hypothetical protein [Ktedonobacter sp. SOSP1-52]GHO65424.1 hypothetical protein KSC_043160 [Ktedonobacter sp. SOSP1-52]